MYPRRPISTSLRRLLQVPNKTPNNVVVVRLHHASELHYPDALLLDFYNVFRFTCSKSAMETVEITEDNLNENILKKQPQEVFYKKLFLNILSNS